MRFSLLFWLLTLVTPSSFAQVVASGVYSGHWASAGDQAGSGERTVLEGSSRTFLTSGFNPLPYSPISPRSPFSSLTGKPMLVIQAGKSTLTLGGKTQGVRTRQCGNHYAGRRLSD